MALLPSPSFPHPCSPLPPNFSFPPYFPCPAPSGTGQSLPRDCSCPGVGWDGITVWGWNCGSQTWILLLSLENNSEIVSALEFLPQGSSEPPVLPNLQLQEILKLRNHLCAGIPPAPQEIFPESSETLAVLSRHMGTKGSLWNKIPPGQLNPLVPNSKFLPGPTFQVHRTFGALQEMPCGDREGLALF